MINGIRWPHADMAAEYESGVYASGCTEPWIAQILYSLIIAKQEPVRILELGGYIGTTSAWLLQAALGCNGHLIVVELEIERALQIQDRLMSQFPTDPMKHVAYTLHRGDALEAIDKQPDDSLGFVWVDDDHTKAHVAEELAALQPKMAPGGIIALHDVYGVTDLKSVVSMFGGYSLDFPKIGPAGGLGIIQL